MLHSEGAQVSPGNRFKHETTVERTDEQTIATYMEKEPAAGIWQSSVMGALRDHVVTFSGWIERALAARVRCVHVSRSPGVDDS